MSFQEPDGDYDYDALDEYLSKLGKKKEVKESPVLSDGLKIEINPLRMSKRSNSPAFRKSISNPEPYLSNLKDSTNVPLTSFLSSDENYAQFDEEENIILEELNELYQVFIGWVFSSKSELECSRSIRYKNIIPLCLNLAAKSTKLMKQKVIADFHFMTAVEKNASIIMGERTFGRWILDLMYTVFPPKADFEKDPIWDMGCKLYIQMNKICFNTDADAHNYIHQLIVWPINKYLRQKSTLERYALTKINKL